MANKPLHTLPEARGVEASDLLLISQANTAKKLLVSTLEKWLLKLANGQGWLQSFQKTSTSGLVDTYTATTTKGAKYNLTVTNGKDGAPGKKGDPGDRGDPGQDAFVYIKYASRKPSEQYPSIGDVPDRWLGIHTGKVPINADLWYLYDWYEIKGAKGDVGAPATIAGYGVDYQLSSQGQTVPSGAWNQTIPPINKNTFLWTKLHIEFRGERPIEVNFPSYVPVSAQRADTHGKVINPDDWLAVGDKFLYLLKNPDLKDPDGNDVVYLQPFRDPVGAAEFHRCGVCWTYIEPGQVTLAAKPKPTVPISLTYTTFVNAMDTVPDGNNLLYGTASREV